MDASRIDQWLESRYAQLADERYREFNARIVATVDPERMLGVRTPDLRRMAREVARMSGIEVWLDELPHMRFESMQVHAFVVGALKDYDECVCRINRFLPHVDNWATCDQLSPKVLAKRPKQTTALALGWMESPHTYTCRFGIETLMRNNLRHHFDAELLNAVALVDRGDDYYVNMMRAWFVAEALVWQPAKALDLLKNNSLDCWTHNKAIQKAIESRRVSDGLKDNLRALRRKG
ncbi:MAG: DNA alkylation repair protein [Coriobacteriales bacterium]|nr:DNA alkylation repair protein [Coriobacteriales bacterium]